MPNGGVLAETSDMNGEAHVERIAPAPVAARHRHQSAARRTWRSMRRRRLFGTAWRAQGEERVIHRKVFSERVFRVRNVLTMNCSSTPTPCCYHSCTATTLALHSSSTRLCRRRLPSLSLLNYKQDILTNFCSIQMFFSVRFFDRILSDSRRLSLAEHSLRSLRSSPRSVAATAAAALHFLQSLCTCLHLTRLRDSGAGGVGCRRSRVVEAQKMTF